MVSHLPLEKCLTGLCVLAMSLLELSAPLMFSLCPRVPCMAREARSPTAVTPPLPLGHLRSALCWKWLRPSGRPLEVCSPPDPSPSPQWPRSRVIRAPRFSAPRGPHYLTHPLCPQDEKGRTSTIFLPACQDALQRPGSATPRPPSCHTKGV